MEIFLILAALFVAFNNGANDNFKGLATVWGSDTLNYRQALILATIATLAGSLASWLLADTLVQQFSGRGLVPNDVATAPSFILSVAGGAAVTVFAATWLGLPISTTHALIGSLVGAGLGHSSAVHFDALAKNFFLPLLLSPLLAAALGVALCRLLRRRNAKNDCACVVPVEVSALATTAGLRERVAVFPSIVIADGQTCDNMPTMARGSIAGILDRLHVVSALTICFSRGLNDTPELAALLITAKFFSRNTSVALIGGVMAIGGIFYARKVAETMSHRITRMDASQGLAANLITATLVLFASKFGLPVSTTHVSVGSIAGVGAGGQTLNMHALRNVLLSWIATLPLAAMTAWLIARSI